MATEDGHHAQFKLIVDQHPFTWPEATITGAQIKALPALIRRMAYGKEVPGGKTDPEIADNNLWIYQNLVLKSSLLLRSNYEGS